MPIALRNPGIVIFPAQCHPYLSVYGSDYGRARTHACDIGVLEERVCKKSVPNIGQEKAEG